MKKTKKKKKKKKRRGESSLSLYLEAILSPLNKAQSLSQYLNILGLVWL
jgi:hypothetical protein